MRRAIGLAAFIAISTVGGLAGTAAAETWTKYASGDGGTEWSYDKDYTYKDKVSGRLVVMKSISKPSANFAPGGPDKGVGFVDAIDCRAKTAIQIGAYKPSTGLKSEDNWRSLPPKAADTPLVTAVCKDAASAPVK